MVSTTTPVKMTCLCAPTKHAGSFRCRLHRSQTQWCGRPMPSSPPKTEDVEAVISVVESRLLCLEPEIVPKPIVSLPAPPSKSLEPEIVPKPIVSLPAPPSKSLVRSPPRGASRLNRMSIASQSAANEVLKPLANEEHLSPIKMATGTGVSYSASRGLRPLVFSMTKNGHDRTKVCS